MRSDNKGKACKKNHDYCPQYSANTDECLTGTAIKNAICHRGSVILAAILFYYIGSFAVPQELSAEGCERMFPMTILIALMRRVL